MTASVAASATIPQNADHSASKSGSDSTRIRARAGRSVDCMSSYLRLSHDPPLRDAQLTTQSSVPTRETRKLRDLAGRTRTATRRVQIVEDR